MDVSNLLEAQTAKFQSIPVEKEIPLDIDVGFLTVTDLNPVDDESYVYVQPLCLIFADSILKNTSNQPLEALIAAEALCPSRIQQIGLSFNYQPPPHYHTPLISTPCHPLSVRINQESPRTNDSDFKIVLVHKLHRTTVNNAS
ncbi:hypothetical protein J3A83DRAFT_2190666 [Scleroderma citrinum]